jgi:long-subunit acyl-CoA synthetase (AMP-forming)
VKVYYRDIIDKSKSVASALTRLGFKKGDLLYFVTYETAVLYLVQMGVWQLGGCVRGGFQMETEGIVYDKIVID